MKLSLLRLAFLNSTRNLVRSGLTAGIIVGGTALLIISLSWLDGVWGQILTDASGVTGHIRVVTPEHAERASTYPIDENIQDVAPVLEALGGATELVGAYPIIETGATLTVGEEIGDVFGQVVGAPQEWFANYLKGPDKVVEGRWLQDGRGELVLGMKLVERAGAKLGDEVVLLGSTQDGSMSPVKGTLVGIAHGGSPVYDRRVFVDLELARYMLDLDGGAMKVLAYTETYRSAPGLIPDLQKLPALSDLDVRAWDNMPPFGQSVGVMDVIRYVLMFMVAFLAGLGVWNTMMMSVLERTKEIGVLRAMGMTRMGAVVLFVFESTSIAIAGGVLGVVAGALPSLYMERTGWSYPENLRAQIDFVVPDALYADLTLQTVGLAFATALLTAVLGTALPAIRAALVQPVTAMRRN